jgi:hypothetical protein
VRWQARVDADVVGTAVHAFFAADERGRAIHERHALATDLLSRHGIADALRAEDLIAMADRLWAWVGSTFGADAVVRTEWPLSLRLPGGTQALGTADLVVEAAHATAVVDHKSFGIASARSKTEALAGQLGCYADAISRARPGAPVSTWVHLPFEGVVVQLSTDATVAR